MKNPHVTEAPYVHLSMQFSPTVGAPARISLPRLYYLTAHSVDLHNVWDCSACLWKWGHTD